MIGCTYSSTRMSGHCFKDMQTVHFPPHLSIYFLCGAAYFSTGLICTWGMQVMSTGSQTFHKAEGESVTLGCRYTPSPFDSGDLDIEWSVVSPDTTQKDQMLLSYTSGTQYFHADLANGLSFAASDPSRGDASLSIADLSPAHSATYQCKVKKSPGVDTRKVTLVVLVKPSVPKCRMEGGGLIGEAVSLHCKSAKGSAPLKYRWRRESGDPIPAATAQDSVTGDLKISNHSQSSAGIYLCEVTNKVGTERCRIHLKADKPPNRAAVIIGTVVGSLLLIFVLLVFIGLLYWKLSTRRHFEKEFSNEIREDATPPESRPASCHRSWSAGRRPQVTYRNEGGVLSTHPPSCDSHGHTPVKYLPVDHDSEYGHAV